jgi:hypothetical protein
MLLREIAALRTSTPDSYTDAASGQQASAVRRALSGRGAALPPGQRPPPGVKAAAPAAATLRVIAAPGRGPPPVCPAAQLNRLLDARDEDRDEEVLRGH